MRRASAWWLLAEEVCGKIATPKVDVAAADAEVEALLRDSWLWSCGESVASKLQAAWVDSRCRVLLRSLTTGRP
jgi:hypothetical protein